ncbi:MAG: CotH kinase family protein [Bacteroidales bacterium]|nr:CotH kinase family protein [Bacteroidales bacterium]
MGEDTTEYQKNYTLKSSKLDNPWEDLIKVTYILNKTPLAHLEDSLSNYLDIDRTLWMLACENIFLDDDGYVFKGGMDYYLYFEPETQRMVTLLYDGNATFSSFNSNWSPFINEKNENYPLLNRVLKVPSLRQRYLAHVRIIIQESLNPAVIDPIIDPYAALIGETVQEDPIKLSTNQEFDEEIPTLKNFAIKRKTYLLSNAEVNQKGVFIIKITVKAKTTGNPVLIPNEPAVISVAQNKSDQIKQINLWYSTGLVGKFSKISMSDQGKNGDDISGDNIYKAVLPGFPKGTLVRYYLEVISSDKLGTATYATAGAEHDVFAYKVR